MRLTDLFKWRASPYIVEIFAGADGARWRIRHRNGEILCSSECYSSVDKAEQTAGNLAAAGKFQYVAIEEPK